jgi:hypothetical protein
MCISADIINAFKNDQPSGAALVNDIAVKPPDCRRPEPLLKGRAAMKTASVRVEMTRWTIQLPFSFSYKTDQDYPTNVAFPVRHHTHPKTNMRSNTAM